MIFSDKNMTPFDGEIIKELEEGLIIADGEKPKLITKNITANNTYNSSSDNADGYNKVIVNVANSYSQADNGKVVSNQELVTQTAYPTTITENDTYDTTNYNSITVNVSGSGGVSGTDVVFYDYDGTVVTSYSAEDFANLTAMPANPTHEGLVAQGWNWTLADAKEYVANYKNLIIGQSYTTDNGDTRLYIRAGLFGATIQIKLFGSGSEAQIDWGDGSELDTWTGGEEYISHTYEGYDWEIKNMDYVVRIIPVTGTFKISEFGSSSAQFQLYKAEIGSNITNFNAIFMNTTLNTITIPNTVTSFSDNSFYGSALKALIVPSGITEVDYMFAYGCSSLSVVSLPRGIGRIGDGCFENCSALAHITIPDTVQVLDAYSFLKCGALQNLTIPNSVRSIGAVAFEKCTGLTSMIIPENVTSLGTAFVRDCDSLKTMKFIPTTPPTAEDNFELIQTCLILVPEGTIDTYMGKHNYPSYDYYIYEEYQTS